jgi:thioredoxin 1
MADRVTIAKLNIDDHPEAASRYGVMSIPTMILFKNGERAATKVGAEPKSRIQAWLEEQL